MAHYHWRELFPPHIWQRGQNYYRNGNILDIRYRSNCVTAEIEGKKYIISNIIGCFVRESCCP